MVGIARIAMVVFFSFLMFSCAPGKDGQIFSVSLALSGNPSTLDPHATTETLTFQVTRSLYDTLLEPDSEGNLKPALAQRWEVSADNLSIILHLRKDVRFHDGSRFDGADVLASIRRIRSEEFASPNAAEFAGITDLLLIDDFTVLFRLAEPNAPFLYTLASGWAAILPSEAIEAGYLFAEQAIGTGPFTLNDWVADERITLARNEEYWGDRSGAEQLVFQIISESAVQIQSLISGKVDILYTINNEDLPILEAADDIVIETLESSLVLVMSINTSRDPLTQLPMRQALSHAIDKQAVLDIAYGGGTVIGTFNDTGSPFYADYTQLYPYDPDRARQLALEAGYNSAQVFDLVVPQNFATHVRAGELYQEMLRKVGIQAKIRLVDWPTWISDVYGNADYDLTVIGHTGKLDPDGRFIGYGSGDLYVRWPNAELVSLIDAGRRTLDFPARREIYQQVQGIFAEQLPFIFVGTPTRRLAYSANIQGFSMTPNLDTFDFRSLTRIEQPRSTN